MPSWKRFFDKDYVYAEELGAGDHTVVIERVTQGELQVVGTSRKEKKPLAHFIGKKKPLVLNTTNCKTIAKMYGNNTDEWAGKPIAIYATITTFAGEEVPCIRVRPAPPKARAAKNATPPETSPETEEETRDATH